MVEILDFLMEILCQKNTLSACQQFVQAYPTITEQLIWFLFFPLLFLFIFTHLLSEIVVKGNLSQTVIKIAVLVFIVVQGYYHIILILGKFWIFAIIFLGGLYVLTHKMGIKGDGGGGKSDKQASKSANWVKQAIFGQRILNPAEMAKNRKLCMETLEKLERQRAVLQRRYDKQVAVDPGGVDALNKALAELDGRIIDVRMRMAKGRPPED